MTLVAFSLKPHSWQFRRDRTIHYSLPANTCCADRWVVERWSACSKTCGKLGYQTRVVQCMQAQHNGTNKPVHSKHCTEDRPDTRRACNQTLCPAQWRTGAWSQVSTDVGPLAAVLLIMLMLNKYYFPLFSEIWLQFNYLGRFGTLLQIQRSWFTFFFSPDSARWLAAKGFSRGRWSAKPATTPLQNARVKNQKQSSFASWRHVQVRARLTFTTVPLAWGLAHMPYSCGTTCCRTPPNIMGNDLTQTAFDRLFLNDESHYTRNCVNIAALTYYCLFLMDNWIQIPEQQSQACWAPFLNILCLQLEIATINI